MVSAIWVIKLLLLKISTEKWPTEPTRFFKKYNSRAATGDYFFIIFPTTFLNNNNVPRRSVEICHDDYCFETAVEKIVKKVVAGVALN